MNVYVAASWRTVSQPRVVEALRADGHDVYDFRHHGFGWHEIDPLWEQWTTQEYLLALDTTRAVEGFTRDVRALQWCHALVLVQPSGRSAAVEFGWAVGRRLTVVYLSARIEPDLMLKMADLITDDLGAVRTFLQRRLIC